MRGGKRTRSGRKKGFAAKNAEEARRLMAELVSAEITPIAFALIKKAKAGDIRATQLLFERAWGKPVFAELEKKDWEPVVIIRMFPSKKQAA